MVGRAARTTTIFFIAWMVVSLAAPPARASELRPETVEAFDRYVHASEARMDDDLRDGNFLFMDSLPGERRDKIYAQVRQEDLFIEQLHTLADDGRPIHIPGGLIHHWIGIAFIPNGSFARTLDVLQDYKKYGQIYKPDVRRSELLEQDGDVWKVYLQMYKKSLVSVVLNGNFDASEHLLSSARAEIRSYSTRIAEVRDPEGPNMEELPVGKDHGYLWRLYSYWRIEEKDSGVYLQVESIVLSRTIPPLTAWLVDPIVRDLSRAVIANLLNATAKAVTGDSGESPAPTSSLVVIPAWREVPVPRLLAARQRDVSRFAEAARPH
jgi:hypothetical protein